MTKERDMKNLLIAALLITAGLLGACSTNGMQPASGVQPATAEHVTHNAGFFHTVAQRHETMLLVSLDDGSVIMQTIDSGADVCFKKNTDSSTTCLRQGSPIIDPATNTVIGFEMIEEQIDLIAKSN